MSFLRFDVEESSLEDSIEETSRGIEQLKSELGVLLSGLNADAVMLPPIDPARELGTLERSNRIKELQFLILSGETKLKIVQHAQGTEIERERAAEDQRFFARASRAIAAAPLDDAAIEAKFLSHADSVNSVNKQVVREERRRATATLRAKLWDRPESEGGYTPGQAVIMFQKTKGTISNWRSSGKLIDLPKDITKHVKISWDSVQKLKITTQKSTKEHKTS